MMELARPRSAAGVQTARDFHVGGGADAFADAEADADDNQAQQAAGIAGKQGEERPPGNGEDKHFARAEAVAQDAAGNLEQGIAREKGAHDHAHFTGGKVKFIGNIGYGGGHDHTVKIGNQPDHKNHRQGRVPVLPRKLHRASPSAWYGPAVGPPHVFIRPFRQASPKPPAHTEPHRKSGFRHPH